MSYCQQTVGEYSNYYPCGKPAKFTAPSGLKVCGVHRRVVDRYFARQPGPDGKKRCFPLSANAGPKP